MSLIGKVLIVTGAAITLVGVALLFLDQIIFNGRIFSKPLAGDAGPGGPAY